MKSENAARRGDWKGIGTEPEKKPKMPTPTGGFFMGFFF
jgi:hypothetical protein